MFKNKMNLTAQICIIPFSNFLFYKKDYIEEIAKKKDVRDYNKYYKETLISDVYFSLNKTSNIENLDSINLLFNKFYPKNMLNKPCYNISKYYMEHLSKLSNTFITSRNGRIAFKYWKSDKEDEFIGPYSGQNKIALWNSLNRMFAVDILVVRYLLDNNMEDERFLDGYWSSIMLEDLQLEQVLERGVAETHIHKRASTNFYMSWQNIMNLNGKKISKYKEEFIANKLLRNEKNFEIYVMAIAICRLVMADYLLTNDYSCQNSFSDYLKNYYDNDINDKHINDLVQGVINGKDIKEEGYELVQLWERLQEKLGVPRSEALIKSNIKSDILDGVFEQEKKISTPMVLLLH